MTEKEKQIEEMAIGVCEYRKARGYKKCDDCDWGGECGVTEYARELYDAGYRKQSEVAKEFAESIKMAFYYEFDELIPSIMADKIDELVEEVCGDD